MVMTAEQAVANVRPGQRIFIATAGAQPLRLVRALVARHARAGRHPDHPLDHPG